MSAGKSTALFIGGALVGSGVAYFVAKNLLEKKYAAQAEEEIASVRESYIDRMRILEDELRKEDEKPIKVPNLVMKTPNDVPKERIAPSNEELYTAYHNIRPSAEVVEGLKETVTDLGYARKEETVKEEADATLKESGYKYIEEDRDINTPYVIPVQSYMDGEELYSQFTFTYYAGDKTLVNEADEIVTDINGVIGYHNLDKFGEESGNDDTVYVRNDRLESDYEVLRDPGKYSQNVMGVDTWDETPEPPIRKFRD